MKPAMNRGKVFVVEQAELMNAQAQNAMLKTLEEPAGRTLIILLTDQPGLILQTVRSRSQLIRFATLDREVDVAKRGEAAGIGLAQRFDLQDGLHGPNSTPMGRAPCYLR